MENVCFQTSREVRVLSSVGVLALLVLLAALPAAATIGLRPGGNARAEISAKCFSGKGWRNSVTDKLQREFTSALVSTAPFIDWSRTDKVPVKVSVSIHDDDVLGVVMTYAATIDNNPVELQLDHQLFSIHAVKPAVEDDLYRPASAFLRADFANEAVVKKLLSNIFYKVALAAEVIPPTQRDPREPWSRGDRVVIPLRFKDLRIASETTLTINAKSRYRPEDPLERIQIQLTPVYDRVSDPDAGAVEAPIGQGDVLAVRSPPAENIEVFMSNFVKDPVYHADLSGNSHSPR